MSAILLMALTLCGAGDNIVSSAAIYGGSFNLFAVTLPKLGIQTRFFDPDDSAEDIEKLIDDKTKLIFTETVANPSIKIIDFEKIANIAQKHGVVYADDNTLATPVLCKPFDWGVNVVVHSSFNEPDESYHGLVYADLPAAQFATKCRAQMMRDLGAIMSPQNAFLSWLGCDTLALRMERHSSNAAKAAAYLSKHPKIDWVLHASLPDNKYHALAQKYLPNGTGGMLSFGIKGDVKQAAKFMEALQLITQETHVADARSCILHPASTTHRQLTPEELKAAGVPENLVRLSVGIEHPDDIIADLEQALAKI